MVDNEFEARMVVLLDTVAGEVGKGDRWAGVFLVWAEGEGWKKFRSGMDEFVPCRLCCWRFGEGGGGGFCFCRLWACGERVVIGRGYALASLCLVHCVLCEWFSGFGLVEILAILAEVEVDWLRHDLLGFVERLASALGLGLTLVCLAGLEAVDF